jgi:hypothetical protein
MRVFLAVHPIKRKAPFVVIAIHRAATADEKVLGRWPADVIRFFDGRMGSP